MRRNTRLLQSVGVLLAIAPQVGCSKPNPAYCNADTECSNGTHCDLSSHSCALGEIDGSSPQVCLGEGNYRVCFDHAETAPLNIQGGGSSFIDTDTSGLCRAEIPASWRDAGQPDACFIVAGTIDVGRTAVSGSRPLVIVGFEHIRVLGLDASSHFPGDHGNATPFGGCLVGIPPQANSGGGGGGAGGSFMTTGGTGGAGNGGAAMAGIAGTATAAPSTLRAGCDGQLGGEGTGSSARITAGGGGAVYLVSGTMIDLRDGFVNASGGGASANGSNRGGNGGGSGGMIVLHAPFILTNASTKLMANGGGGAGGAPAGGAGQDPEISSPTVPAGAGTADTNCGSNNGGTGAAQGAVASSGGNGTSTNCGGGGGGGGLGYIQTNIALGSGVFSPAPVVP